MDFLFVQFHSTIKQINKLQNFQKKVSSNDDTFFTYNNRPRNRLYTVLHQDLMVTAHSPLHQHIL